jgi:hypothetical protein
MFLHFLIKFLETIFCIGLAGSMVVAILAFVGDIHVFFDKDEEPARANIAS